VLHMAGLFEVRESDLLALMRESFGCKFSISDDQRSSAFTHVRMRILFMHVWSDGDYNQVAILCLCLSLVVRSSPSIAQAVEASSISQGGLTSGTSPSATSVSRSDVYCPD
jgi:hypothetical protein